MEVSSKYRTVFDNSFLQFFFPFKDRVSLKTFYFIKLVLGVNKSHDFAPNPQNPNSSYM